MKQVVNYQDYQLLYDTEYNTNIDQAFLSSFVDEHVQNILEFPCRGGRNFSWLSATKRTIFLVDEDASMAYKVSRKIHASRNKQLHILNGNVTDIFLPEKMDLILMPQGGIQSLPSCEAIEQSLYVCAQHLQTGGKIIVDIGTFSMIRDAVSPSYFNPTLPNGVEVFDWDIQCANGHTLQRKHTQYAEATRHITNFTYSVLKNGTLIDVYTITMQSLRISFHQFEEMCKHIKLKPLAVYRNYDKEPYNSEGSRMIFVLTHG